MIKSLFKNVLVMINGTEASINAVRYAILMAKQYQCGVRAVYVVDTATIRQLGLNRIFVEEESREYERSLEMNGQRYLAFVEQLGKEKGVKVATELRRGAIWSEIVTAAEESKADLILLGGTESTQSDKDVHSTTHKSILVNARCSVLVVKEKAVEQLFKLA